MKNISLAVFLLLAISTGLSAQEKASSPNGKLSLRQKGGGLTLYYERQPVIDQSEIYSGIYGWVNINFYPYFAICSATQKYSPSDDKNSCLCIFDASPACCLQATKFLSIPCALAKLLSS